MNRKQRSIFEFILLVGALFAVSFGLLEANKTAPIKDLLPDASIFIPEGAKEDISPTLERVLETKVSPNTSLSLITQPEAGTAPLIEMIDTAKVSVDLVMYSFNDPLIEAALIRAHKRGLPVRVMLNAGYEGDPSSKNEKTRLSLLRNGVEVRWSPSYFLLTHQKTLIIDRTTALIMTFNIDKTYYRNNRDFGIINKDPDDVAAIQNAFNSDWQGKRETPSDGDDLIWSPGAEDELVALIESANTSLHIYCQLMNETAIEDVLMKAARKGVNVQVLMTSQADWLDAYERLTDAGVHISTFEDNKQAPVYIHAKVIVADEKLAYLGSENFSDASLNKNRELGLFISQGDIVRSLVETFKKDWVAAAPYN